MERLLRFAVEHDRVIRLMFMRDGRLFQVNAHIVSYDDKQVSFVTTRSPRTQAISRAELLAVAFRRGVAGAAGAGPPPYPTRQARCSFCCVCCGGAARCCPCGHAI